MTASMVLTPVLHFAWEKVCFEVFDWGHVQSEVAEGLHRGTLLHAKTIPLFQVVTEKVSQKRFPNKY